jgi:hypothetical protein
MHGMGLAANLRCNNSKSRMSHKGHEATMPHAPLCQLPPAADMPLIYFQRAVVLGKAATLENK